MSIRIRWRWRLLVALVATLATVLVVVAPYERQIHSYLTHWKGSPTHTEPYSALPGGGRALHIAVVGDIGDGGHRLAATAAALERIARTDPFDVLLLLGDNVYPSGDPTRLPELVFKPFAGVLDGGAQLLAIVGNHDAPHADEQMTALGIPGRWWSVERNSVLVVGLDSNHPHDAHQLAWLEDTLRTSSARWKIVALHHPPYSAGYQGSNHAARDTFAPLFERYGVQLVMSGHDHDYQRSVDMKGVTYVVTGAASGTRRTGEESFTAVSFSWHSFVELGIYHDRLVGRAVNQDPRIADEFELVGPSSSGP